MTEQPKQAAKQSANQGYPGIPAMGPQYHQVNGQYTLPVGAMLRDQATSLLQSQQAAEQPAMQGIPEQDGMSLNILSFLLQRYRDQLAQGLSTNGASS